MREISLLIICAMFALSTAKQWPYTNSYSPRGYAHQEGYYDSGGRYHVANNQFASTQQKPGRTQCQSASYENGGLTTYVHVCEAGKDSNGEQSMQRANLT